MKSFDIVLEAVTKRFGKETAVNQLSLKIPRGEYLCMLGPSGCGKTTTLRMIAGLLQPNEGNIYLDNQRVNDVPANERNTATVFQSFALFPHLNVRQNVGFGLKMRRTPKAERNIKVSAMLAQMGLAKMASKMPEELSMGERQRVALAKSLIIEPRVLLLDEPLSSIDVTLKNKILIDLREIHDRLGLTFIHVTHDPEEAMANADRIMLMRKGTVEQLDSPFEMFNRPKTKFVAQFFQNCNIIEGIAERSQGESVLVANDLGRFKVSGCSQIPSLGKEVCIAIRHDRVRLASGEETQNRIEGKLIGKEIVGAVITYIVRISGDRTIKFQSHMSLDTAAFDLNEKISLAWDASDAILLT